MCRHYGFHSNEPTKVECTLVHTQNALLAQSRRDMRGAVHADGWGISVYHHEHPEVERRATAAFEDMHFNATAARLFSKTVVAHVRKATVGGPSLANTHPFVHGHWSFCHNGTVTGFAQLRKQLIHETHPSFRSHRLGTTDSEQLFYWLLSRMQDRGVDVDRPCRSLTQLESIVAESIREIDRRCRQAAPTQPPRLNLILTEGNVLLATRWGNSLYWTYHDGLAECEYCRVPHVEHRPGIDYRAIVVASEPISHQPWQEVSDQTILTVGPEIRPRLRGIDETGDGKGGPGAPCGPCQQQTPRDG